MRFRLARSKKYLCLVAFVGVLVFICYLASSVICDYIMDVVVPKLFKMQRDNITCYAESYNAVNETNFASNSIFLYQTSCERTVPLRAACAIEAACMAHRHRKVYLVFTTAPDLTDDVMIKLRKIKNLRIVTVDVIGTFSRIMPGVPFLKTVKSEGRLYKMTADFLKLVTLFEHGGVVMDMDVILSKPLQDLGSNWVLRDRDGFNLVAMRLSYNDLGKVLADTILLHYRNTTTIKYRSAVDAVYSALEKLCNISGIKYNITGSSLRNCKDLKIYNRKMFEPISYEDSYLYFEPGEWNLGELSEGYGYHTWDTHTRKYLREDSLYAILSRTFCPRLFSTFMYEFLETDDS